MVELYVVGEPGRRLALDDRQRTIGRSANCDLQVRAGQVSGNHAAAWLDGGTAWICDLGSTNGTCLNGRLVGGEPQPLRLGDRLDLAGIELTLTMRQPGQLGHPVPAGLVVGSQHGRQINNVDGHQVFDNKVTHHNNLDVDVNPLPRSRAGRRMIYCGILFKLVGTIMALSWVFQLMSYAQADLNRSWDRPEEAARLSAAETPSMMPWVPLGVLLFLVGGSLSITGIVAAYSSRRRSHGHQYR